MKFPSHLVRVALHGWLFMGLVMALVGCDDDEDDPSENVANFEVIVSTDFEATSLDSSVWAVPDDSSRFELGSPAVSGTQSLRLQMREGSEESNDSTFFSVLRIVVLDQAYDELRLKAMTRCSGGGVAQLVLAQTLPDDDFLSDALWRRRCTASFTPLEFIWRDNFSAGDTLAIVLDGERTTGMNGEVWFDDLELAGR